MQCQSNDIEVDLRWIKNSRLSKFRREVFQVVVAAIVYLIWQSRNEGLWNHKIPSTASSTRLLQMVIKRENYGCVA